MGMKGSVTICSWCHRLPDLLTGLKLQQPARTVTREEVSVAEAEMSLWLSSSWSSWCYERVRSVSVLVVMQRSGSGGDGAGRRGGALAGVLIGK